MGTRGQLHKTNKHPHTHTQQAGILYCEGQARGRKGPRQSDLASCCLCVIAWL